MDVESQRTARLKSEMTPAFDGYCMHEALFDDRFLKDTGVSEEKVNVNGGSIALGHPLGATGGMILGTVLDELEARNQRYGLCTLCVGGGMGIATIIERV